MIMFGKKLIEDDTSSVCPEMQKEIKKIDTKLPDIEYYKLLDKIYKKYYAIKKVSDKILEVKKKRFAKLILDIKRHKQIILDHRDKIKELQAEKKKVVAVIDQQMYFKNICPRCEGKTILHKEGSNLYCVNIRKDGKKCMYHFRSAVRTMKGDKI